MATQTLQRLFALFVATTSAVFVQTSSAQEALRYLVNYTNTPPIIDGQSTVGEWRDAAPALDQWVLLGSHQNSVFDDTNNRFMALWDESGLYIQHQVDYAEWDERGQILLDADYETLEFHFDPNMDLESNDQTKPTDTGVDSYTLLINQPYELSVINRFEKTAGFYSDARTNGNAAGLWSGFANMEMAQVTSIAEKTGYTELFLPWQDFNATNPQLGFSEEFGDDIGLYHPGPPIPGAEWFFNIGRHETGGNQPAWSVASP
ncbi:MAG: hypothetical protein KDB27_02895, partial [Planctomycetales bacterium]|nr:hypothetical protein [Planctomycetales bacterium]